VKDAMKEFEEALDNYGAACSKNNEYDNRVEVARTRAVVIEKANQLRDT
jgi:hypothetical protein